VSEGSGENIFVVRKGILYTPDLSCSILEGVTRDTVITLAREMGLTVEECRITRDQLWLADEVFLTGTAAEITPVREVDNRTIGTGTVGPITAQIQTRFFDVVRGSDSSHPEWLTRV
jgi:branched-chain amino acid aminotransferase